MEKVIVIVGPTGVGKTSLSLKIAKELNTEIISGDSMQVYKEMNIGTAKIKEKEKKGIKHHLINIKNIDENYSVYDFQKEVRSKIKEISNKNKVPIVVGGTGLYLKAALYDYEFVKEENKKDYSNKSIDELLVLLKARDEKTYNKIDKNNKRRVIRALQITDNNLRKSSLIEKQENKPIYNLKMIGLTMSRDKLYENINKRVDLMIKAGLLKEVKDIYEKYKDRNLTSLQAIGYKEFFPYFKKEKTLEESIELLKKKTRNYAKKQYTWFKNKMDVTWFDKEDSNLFKKVMEYINE